MLVDKEVVTKAVAVPEPAATVPKPEVTKEPRASSLRIDPRLKRLVKPEPRFRNESLRGTVESIGYLRYLQCIFRFFPIYTDE